MPDFTRHLMVALMLLASTGASAVSIGEIDVASHLGEPLLATVPLTLEEGTLPDDGCIRIVGPARHHPDLASARVTLGGQGEKRVVTITTRNPVNDPVIDLALRTQGCGASIQRDFVILLSPKDIQPVDLPVVARPAATVASRAETPRPDVAPVAAPAPRKQPPRFVLRLDYGYGEFGRLAERITRRNQAAYEAGLTQRSAADRRAAANASASSRVPPTGVATAPANRPQAGMDDKAANRQSAPPSARTVAPPQTGATDHLVLREPPADFTLPALDAGPTGQVDPTQPADATNQAAVPAGEDSGQGAATSRTGQDGIAIGIPAPAAQPAPARAWYAWFLTSFNLFFLLLIVLLALAIALWLKWRKPHSRFMDKSVTGLHTLLPADSEYPQLHPTLARDLPSTEEGFVEPPETKTLLGEALEARPLGLGIEAMEFTPVIKPAPIQAMDMVVEPHESIEHVMELAEVMLAFGRTGQAIEALSQHIRANPRQALEPWLKLLDLYHQANSRSEFDALAAQLHRNFNIAIPEWADFSKDSTTSQPVGPLTLESLPHIMSRLSTLWGTQEGLDYVDKLLEDNRSGQRLGFSMPIVRDILLLRDILRQTCPVSALSH